MKKYTIIIILAFIAISNTTQAQLFPFGGGGGKDEGLKYSDLNSNTDINYFSVGLGLLNLGIGKTLIMSLEPEMSVLYKNLFLTMSYNYSYLNFPLSSDDNMAESVYKSSTTNSFSLMGGYYFKKQVDGKVPIILSTQHQYRTTITTMTNVDATYEQLYGIEAGIKKGSTLLLVDGQFSATQPLSSTPTTVVNTPAKGHFTTMMDYTYFCIGGSIGTLTDVSATFSEYGERKNRGLVRYYAHLLLPMKTDIDDIYWYGKDVNGNKTATRYSLNNTVPKTKIGWRIGYDYNAMSALTSGIELMCQPGISQDTFSNIYLLVKFRLNLTSTF